MRRIGNVEISTTPELPGWTIREHLGPVSAHVVAGAGVVGEILAGLADLLGSRSTGHSERLAGLAEEAVGRLRSEVIALGGNALVGLRTDYRELSAGGRSMLLVVASGTALEGEPAEDGQPAGVAGHGGGRSRAKSKTVLVSGAAVRTEVRREELERRIEAGVERLEEAEWEFLVTHRVRGLGREVLALVERALAFAADAPERRRVIAAALDYFRVLRFDDAVEALYPALAGGEGVAYFVLHVIEQLELFDPARVLEMVRGGEVETGRRALQAVRAEKRFYDHVDLEKMDALREAIPDAFPRLAVSTEEKSLLSMGELRSLWVCALCGHKNPETRPHCAECGREPWGFPGGFLGPEGARALLASRSAALRACFERG